MALFYCKNIVTYSNCVIFINTSCNENEEFKKSKDKPEVAQPSEYKDAEKRGQLAQDLFIETLEFDDVKPYVNYKKADIIQVLEDLEKKAEQFQ